MDSPSRSSARSQADESSVELQLLCDGRAKLCEGILGRVHQLV
jgi:hypothetical protein